MNYSRLVLAMGLGGWLAGTSTLAGAAGFQLFEYSGRGIGNAFAGGAAAAEDASTVHANPAGMSRLDGTQLVVASHFIAPSADFKNKGTRTFKNPTLETLFPGLNANTAMAGDGTQDGGENAVVPNLYISHRLNQNISLGLGVNAPFGLATAYDKDWVGRYHGLKTELRTVNLNPSIAFQVNDKFALGVGANATFADLREYSNALDSAAMCLAAGAAPAACQAGIGPLGNAATDGKVTLKGDDWGYGFNAGIMFTPSKATRIGLHYRSKVDLELEGDATFKLHPVVAAGAGLQTNTKGSFKVDVELPATVSLSSFQTVNDKWDMMGDITWTDWSSFKELVANLSGATPISQLVQPENWEDTFRIALGMTYHYSPALDLRFGIARDQSAITHAADRGPRIPDSDRNWVTFGISYAPTDSLLLDLNYAHLFIPDQRTNTLDPSFGHLLVGEFESEVDILSGQLTWTF